MPESVTNFDNPYILRALAFAQDKPTHSYRRVLSQINIASRDREIALHCFVPREPDSTLPPLALIPGGPFSSAQTFYTLGPNLITAEPHRMFVFLDSLGTGDSGRDVRGLNHLDFGRIYLHGLRAALGDALCLIGGHSQGGGYAQTIARLNSSPQATVRLNLKGLVLLDSVPLEGAVYMVFKIIRYGLTMKGLVRNVLTSPDAPPELVEFFEWAFKSHNIESRPVTLANMRGKDFPDVDHPFNDPVLILGAAESRVIRQESLRRMEASTTYPRAVYCAIASLPGETAGHSSYLDYARTAEMIVQFLHTQA